MMDIINNKNGYGGTNSSRIAEILSIESVNNFKHLIIVTDGQVSQDEIKKSDEIMKSNKNIKLEYVTTFIIETTSTTNLSVGAPYCRQCPNSTIFVNKQNKEFKQPSLFEEDLREWENLEKSQNYNQNNFLSNFSKIQNAVKAKTLGASSENTLQILQQFKEKCQKETPNPEFISKIDSLIKLAKEGNMNMELKVT